MSMDMGTGGAGVEYADHEVQTLNFQITTADGSTQEGRLKTDPVSQRGLDNDEIAELVGFYRTLSLQPSGQQNGTQLGPLNVEVGFGINTDSVLENLTDLPSNATIVEDPDASSGVVRIGESDDPGIIDGSAVHGLEDTDLGAGSIERTMNFKDMLGSGPYVDATDDLVFNGEVQSQTGDNFILEYGFILYWEVQEMPEGRASFSRP